MDSPSIAVADSLSDRDRLALRSLARRINPADPGAQNNLGVLYFHKGLVEESIAAFQRALALDSRMQTAQDNLDLAYRRTGYYDRKVAELQDRLRTAPDDRAARWELARDYAALGHHDEALHECQALAARFPDDVAVVVQLGLIEKQRGNLDAAGGWFQRAIDLDPSSSVSHFYLGETLYNRGLTAPALAALEQAIGLNAENADAHYLLAFVLGELDRHEEARAAAKRAVQLNPALGRAQANLSLERPLGGRRSTAMRAQDLHIDPAGEEALAHHNLGRAFRQRGYYNEALREYRLALDAGEDRRLVLQAMAEVQLLKREHVAALELYERLLDEVTDAPKLWNERGVVLQQLGRTHDAIRSYEQALALAPGYGLARNNLAVALALTGQHEQALNAFGDAVRARPELQSPRLNLGLLLLKLRRFQPALQAYRQLLDESDSGAAGWNGVGAVLMELGRAADARNAFARAVERDPNSAEAHYNLSFALSSVGDYDAALREVSRAQSLDPYYVPQKFRLAIDLQHEDPTIAVVPDIAAGGSGELPAQHLALGDAALEQMIRELERPRPRRVSSSFGDPFALARDYMMKGLLEQAAAEVARAVTRGAIPADAHQLAAEIHLRRGEPAEALLRYDAAVHADPAGSRARLGRARALVLLGRVAEAVAEAESLAAGTTHDVEALLVLASARQAQGDLAAALKALADARRRAPDRADVLKQQGDIAARLQDFEMAQGAYEAAVALDPRFVQVWVDLGRIQETREAHDAAERSFRQALDILPTHQEAALALAALYRRRGKARAAVNLLVENLAADPGDVETLVGLGHALLDDGRALQALEVFRRALRHDERHIAAHFFAGVVYARLQRYREAAAEWESVIRLDAASPLAAEARKHARTASDLARIFRTEAA